MIAFETAHRNQLNAKFLTPVEEILVLSLIVPRIPVVLLTVLASFNHEVQLIRTLFSLHFYLNI